MAGSRHRFRDDAVVESGRFRFVVSGEYVPFGTDEDAARFANDQPASSIRWLPTWVEFELGGLDEPDFYCTVELRDDVPRVVELGWRSTEDQTEIRQKHLRSAEVSNIANLIYGTWIVELQDVQRGKVGAVLTPKLNTEQAVKIRNFFLDLRSGRRHVTAELLSQVAEVYRANFDTAPAEAVARTFGVKQRMAHEYVRKARERGFLPPTTQGKKKV
jgi:hypothetical protein